MPDTSLDAIMTISFTVSDLPRSIRFYEGLGLSVQERMEEGGTLQGVMLGTGAGGATIGLSQDDFSKGRDRTFGTGVRLHFETAQDIDALAHQARNAGIEVRGPQPLGWGPSGFNVTDPDGYQMTVYQKMAE